MAPTADIRARLEAAAAEWRRSFALEAAVELPEAASEAAAVVLVVVVVVAGAPVQECAAVDAVNWLRREAGGLSVSFERRDAGGASKGEALEENIDTPQLALPRDRRRCSECNPPSVARSWLLSSPSSPASACERRLGAALGVPRLDVQEASLLATRRNVPVALVLPDAASSGIIEMGTGQEPSS